MYGITGFVALFAVHCAAADEKLVPLRSACVSSVQCVGVAVCVDRVCKCPPSYTPIGNTCVHSGFENGISSEQLQLFGDKDSQQNSAGSEIIRIGSSLNDKRPSIIVTKITSTSSPISTGYPGQPCGARSECRGNSFCYKGVCSCHAGAIVSGRVCATITSGSKSPKNAASTPAPKTRPTSRSTQKPTSSSRGPLGVEHICPPPLFWADGDCMVPVTDPPATAGNSITSSTKSDIESTSRAVVAICKPPLIVVDGWCTLPGALAKHLNDAAKEEQKPPPPPTSPPIMPAPYIRCTPPAVWIDGRCVSPRPRNPYAPNLPGSLPIPPPPNPVEPEVDEIYLPIVIPAPTPARRCPPGEILINSACLSTDVVVNYPSPLLCRSGNECPGGSTCLSYFCVCPAPFVWHAKAGCDSPSLASAPVESMAQYPGGITNGDMMVARNVPEPLSAHRQKANGFVPLGGRCRRDTDCIERAVCEFSTCACRAPFVPYSSVCVFAPTEEEIALAIQKL